MFKSNCPLTVQISQKPRRRKVAIPAGKTTARVLVVVRVDAVLPVVLHADRAPVHLELVHEKLVGHGDRVLRLLGLGEEGGSDLLARVREGAAVPAAAHGGVRVPGAEALLVVPRVVPGLRGRGGPALLVVRPAATRNCRWTGCGALRGPGMAACRTSI